MDGTDRRAFEYYTRLARVKRHLEEHISEPFPVERAAEVACLSRKYFSTFFHRKTGICFKEWTDLLRIRRAAELIREHDHSLTQVAFNVGFRDMRTFERVFKKHMQSTPRAYKRSARPDQTDK